MIKNHYGVYIDSEIPITGVYSNNSLAWEWLYDTEICLTCEEAVNEHYKHTELDTYSEDCPNCLEVEGYCLEWIECQPFHERIIGDWILDTNTHLYEPNPNGEFAAIEREDVTQVVFSHLTERHGLCSPCYPGQCDVDSTGEFLCYVLPDWALYRKDE